MASNYFNVFLFDRLIYFYSICYYMKNLFFFIFLAFYLFPHDAISQKIAFQKIDCNDYDSYSYVNNEIYNGIKSLGFEVTKICNSDLQYTYWGYESANWMAGIDTRGIMDKSKLKLSAENLNELGYSYLLVPIEAKRIFRICTSQDSLNKSNDVWWCKFNIYNLINLNFKEIKLTISTSGASEFTLEANSNIQSVFTKIQEFVNNSNKQ